MLVDRFWAQASESPDGRSSSLRAIVGEGLEILAAVQGNLSQHLAGGDDPLTATAVPANLSQIGHVVLL
jgi:hypothetical protein